MKLEVNGSAHIRGRCSVPSDKSISHRALMLGVLANSQMIIHNVLRSADVLSTLRCLQELGFSIEDKGVILIHPSNDSLKQGLTLDCGNSGTTMRLLSGLLSAMSLNVMLDGDDSLRRRPMARVAEPLSLLGASIQVQGNGCAPIYIRPAQALHYTEIDLPVASAQLKSACLLLGLQGHGCLVRGGGNSRDHTEKMMQAMGAEVICDDDGTVSVLPGNLRGVEMTIPGDFSSAAFVLCATLILPESKVEIEGVNLNPTRTGLLDVFELMGATCRTTVQSNDIEPLGTITAETSVLVGQAIPEDWIPRLIDELPIISVMATQAKGRTVIRGAQELRIKESDRIATTVSMLRAFGASVVELDDGLIIEGSQALQGAIVDSKHDHRIAMAAAVAALCATGRSTILNAECISVSFPQFTNLFSALGAVMSCTEDQECFE